MSSLSINSNIGAQRALHSVSNASQGVDSSIERLSTGKSINRAADDASGMAIANTLGSEARGAGQLMANAVNDISRAQIADGALGEATGILQGIRDMVVQSNSAALSSDDRGMLQQDINKSLESYGDIFKNTEYNGQKLFSQEPGLSSLSQMDLSTEEGRQDALKMVDEALDSTSSLRSEYGAEQNQLSSNISNLGTQMVNAYQSASTIEDVDIAQESMNMKRMDDLKTTGLFALRQANTQSQHVMSLLGGNS